MDLKTFVSETLTQIVEGVADAQLRIAEGGSNACVNPTKVFSGEQHKRAEPRPVEFDVALVVEAESTDKSSAKAGGSVGFLSIVSARATGELGSETAGSSRSESTSRVRFTVNLAQPAFLEEQRPAQIPRTKTSWMA